MGDTGHTDAPLNSAGKLEQKPEGTSQAAPAQPHSQAQAAAPSGVAVQRPLGPQSDGQPNVVCVKEERRGHVVMWGVKV